MQEGHLIRLNQLCMGLNAGFITFAEWSKEVELQLGLAARNERYSHWSTESWGPQ